MAAGQGFKIADAYVEIHADYDTLKREIGNLPSTVGGDAETAGKKVGKRTGDGISSGVDAKAIAKKAAKDFGDGGAASFGNAGKDSRNKLSQGIQLSLVRNSPLIAAAVGGALAAGAPAAIAGATLLFGGIGIVAAAQSEKVQASWKQVWENIKDGTKADASVLEGTLVSMAGTINSGFQSLRPALRLMFADAAPLLDGFTRSLVTAAQNAMPGLINAVHSATPVMQGLGHLVESIGTGLSGFFDAISQHSGAAGTAFSAIGQILQTLLPLLGTLLGQGAELAAAVLPPLADVLGVVADALNLIAPILPTVAMGFAAFKIVSSLSGPLATLAGNLTAFAQNAAFASYQGGAFGAAAGRVSEGASAAARGVSGLSSALPILGTILVGAVTVLQRVSDQSHQWAQALLEGGQAAETAKAQMSDFGVAMQTTNTGFAGVITGLVGFGAQADATALALKGTKDAQDQMRASMTPLQLAQQQVTQTQNDLNLAVDKYGASSPQAQAAAREYAQAQADVKAQEDQTKLAIDGVTQSMIDQANQALAAASSSFAYDQATQQVADSQARLTELQNSGTASSSELNNATNSLNQALLAQAQAAGRLAADSLPATASETDRLTASNQATLQELYKLRDQMGASFPAALQTAIGGLERSGAATGALAGQAGAAQGPVYGLSGALQNVGAQHPNPTVNVQDNASWQLRNINGMILSIPTVRTVQVNVIGKNVLATGGEVIDNLHASTVTRAASGRVVGPGTGTSDSVPAVGPGGAPWALSNGEWVIRAASVDKLERLFGKGVMPMINNGDVPTSRVNVDGSALAGPTSAGISIGNLTVKIDGVWDLTNPGQLRTVGQKLRDVLIELDREGR